MKAYFDSLGIVPFVLVGVLGACTTTEVPDDAGFGGGEGGVGGIAGAAGASEAPAPGGRAGEAGAVAVAGAGGDVGGAAGMGREAVAGEAGAGGVTSMGGSAGVQGYQPPEPPANATIDWSACEPGGNCARDCGNRPASAMHKPANFTARDFPGPVFVPDRDGIIVVEAEKLARTQNWRMANTHPATADGSTFTGQGFVRWDGYAVSGIDADEHQTYQGNRCDWLVVKIWIPEGAEASYQWEARTHNVADDGDNDAWNGYITTTRTIPRAVTGADVNQRFTFATPTTLLFPGTRMTHGLHAIYFQGRSRGYGLDRIVIHRGGKTRALAQDPKRPESKPFPAGYFAP